MLGVESKEGQEVRQTSRDVLQCDRIHAHSLTSHPYLYIAYTTSSPGVGWQRRLAEGPLRRVPGARPPQRCARAHALATRDAGSDAGVGAAEMGAVGGVDGLWVVGWRQAEEWGGCTGPPTTPTTPQPLTRTSSRCASAMPETPSPPPQSPLSRGAGGRRASHAKPREPCAWAQGRAPGPPRPLARAPPRPAAARASRDAAFLPRPCRPHSRPRPRPLPPGNAGASPLRCRLGKLK